MQSLQTKLVLKTNNQRQASAEFPDEIVTTVIRELIARQKTALSHLQQSGRSNLADEANLKIAALKIYLPTESEDLE